MTSLVEPGNLNLASRHEDERMAGGMLRARAAGTFKEIDT